MLPMFGQFCLPLIWNDTTINAFRAVWFVLAKIISSTYWVEVVKLLLLTAYLAHPHWNKNMREGVLQCIKSLVSFSVFPWKRRKLILWLKMINIMVFDFDLFKLKSQHHSIVLKLRDYYFFQANCQCLNEKKILEWHKLQWTLLLDSFTFNLNCFWFSKTMWLKW